MISTDQAIVVDAAIDEVWEYAKDMQKWASLMPGYRSCDIRGETDSKWVMKVGVGALIRAVNVLVHVDEWNGPERVNFSFSLEGDPVKGRGGYVASPRQAGETNIALTLSVEGSGPMAPVWEAMSRPLLPMMLKSFMEKLKAEIEDRHRLEEVRTPTSALSESLWRRIRKPTS